MSDQEDNQVDIADIRAGVEKTNSRLIFSAVVLGFCVFGFVVKTCASMPPEPIKPDPSIACAKIAGAHWVPEEYKVVDGHTMTVSAYCNTKK